MSRFFSQLSDDMAGVAPLTDADDDAIALLAALVQAGMTPPVEALADLLGWPLERVETAFAAASDRRTATHSGRPADLAGRTARHERSSTATR
jgi:hypothetical protein